MARIRANSGSGGGRSHYEYRTSVATGSTITINCGFTPTKIMLTETNTSNNSVFSYLYDADYATNKIRYMGGTTSSLDKVWTDWNFGTSGSTIVQLTSTGFEWHTAVTRSVGRLDIIAIE